MRVPWVAAAFFATGATCHAAECQGDMAHNAELLRSEITRAYATQRDEADKSGPNGFPIADAISPTIKRGMTFDEAERTLRCAGFKVRPRPGPNAQGTRPDRFDVYADTRSLLSGGWFFSKVVIVVLHPRSPDDYGTVEGVTASIVVTYL